MAEDPLKVCDCLACNDLVTEFNIRYTYKEQGKNINKPILDDYQLYQITEYWAKCFINEPWHDNRQQISRLVSIYLSAYTGLMEGFVCISESALKSQDKTKLVLLEKVRDIQLLEETEKRSLWRSTFKSDFRWEHIVPKKILVEIVLDLVEHDKFTYKDFLILKYLYGTICIILNTEDQKLNKKSLRQSMPKEWDLKTGCPFARYAEVNINIHNINKLCMEIRNIINEKMQPNNNHY